MKRITFLFIITSILCISGKNCLDERYLPVLFFQPNSIAFDTLYDYYENTENIRDTNEVIKYISVFLNKHLQYKITIAGYSDSKEIYKGIALLRSEKVGKLLMENGISENRIIIKSFDASKPKISDKQIEKAENEADKEKLRRLNRKVYFLITNSE